MPNPTDEIAFLVAQSGPLNSQRWAIKTSVLLGREENCDIVINDRQVSRHHARILKNERGASLEDLASKNGTFLNGSLIHDPVVLQDGDVIQIAVAQKFLFLSSDATLPLDGSGFEWETAGLALIPGEKENGRLYLDKRSRRVWIQSPAGIKPAVEKEILPPLSLSQFRLLEILYQNQNQVVPRQVLVAAVWADSEAYEVSEQALDALVRRLRERIASLDPSHPYIITVRGHGLRLDNPPRTGD